MLNRVALVILLPSRSEEIVRALEPIENFHLPFSGTHKENVLPQVVLDHQGIIFKIFKDFQDFEILDLAGQEKRRPPLEIGSHTQFRIEIIDHLHCLQVFSQTGIVEHCVSDMGILGSKVDFFLKLVHQLSKHFGLVVLDGQGQQRIAIRIPQIQVVLDKIVLRYQSLESCDVAIYY